MKKQIKQAKISLLILLAVLITGCGGPPKEVLGVWKLKIIGGSDPAAFEVKSAQIVLSADGKFAFSMVKTSGVDKDFSGTFKISGGDFIYKYGDNLEYTKESRIEIKDNVLTFAPDPIIDNEIPSTKKEETKKYIKTEYERTK